MTAALREAGTIELAGRFWKIHAVPDVMIRLKRALPGVQVSRAPHVMLLDTDEMGRELLWLTSRWTFAMTADDRAHLLMRAEAQDRREQQVQQLLTGTARRRESVVGQLESQLPLREYQRIARDMVLTAGSTLIIDELGLGKTLSGLAVLEDPTARPAIAVTLAGLQGQWLRELDKFYPQLRGVELRTTKVSKELPRILDENGDIAVDLVVLNYRKLWAWREHLSTGLFKTVLFDEIQELRRARSDKYRAAARIAASATYTAGLSATPIYNHGGEIFNVIDALKQEALGTRGEFLREWCASDGYGTDENKVQVAEPEALRANLTARGMMIRRTRKDVGIELPSISTVEQNVPSDTSRFDQLQGNAIEMARLILDSGTGHRQRFLASGEFDMRMRQATGIAKAAFVADFVRLLLESEQKIVMFGWHRAVYDIWMERLAEFNPLMYTGSETAAAKSKAYQQFIDPSGQSRVLMMSLRSGAGLDGLQSAASVLVFGELDWSPGVMKQCIGRLGRPGQSKPVVAYFCVSDQGADPVMLDILNIKSMEADRLIEPEPADALAPAPDVADRIRKLAASVLEGKKPPCSAVG